MGVHDGRADCRAEELLGSCSTTGAGDSRTPSEASRSSEGGKASARSLVLNLITGGLGLGIFSLPWSTAGASLVPGLLMIVLVVSLNAWTISILIEGAEMHQSWDLGALLSNLPQKISRPAQIGTNVSVFLVLFLSQVGYIDVMANAIMDATPIDHRPLAVLISSVVALPLCFLDQRYLSFTSALAVIVNIYIFVVMSLEPKRPSGVCIVGAGRGSVSMVSVMMQAVVIQMCVVPMYKEMEDRTPQKFQKVVAAGFGGLIAIFAAFAAVGYLTFGPSVKGNILDSLPDTIWGKLGRVGAGLCVACVYPIFLQSMVAPFWNMQGPMKRPVATAATAVTVAAVGFVALFLDRVDKVNVYSGAFCAIAFVAGVPGIVGLMLLGQVPLRRKVALWVLVLFGVVTGALGLVYTDNFESEVRENCAWGIH